MFSEIGWPAPTEADENAQKDFVARLPLWMAAGASHFPLPAPLRNTHGSRSLDRPMHSCFEIAGIDPLCTIWALLQDTRPELNVPDAYGTVGLLTRTGAPKAAKKAWEQLLLPTPLPPPVLKPLSEAGSTGTLSRGFGTLRRKNTISTSFEIISCMVRCCST